MYWVQHTLQWQVGGCSQWIGYSPLHSTAVRWVAVASGIGRAHGWVGRWVAEASGMGRAHGRVGRWVAVASGMGRAHCTAVRWVAVASGMGRAHGRVGTGQVGGCSQCNMQWVHIHIAKIQQRGKCTCKGYYWSPSPPFEDTKKLIEKEKE